MKTKEYIKKLRSVTFSKIMAGLFHQISLKPDLIVNTFMQFTLPKYREEIKKLKRISNFLRHPIDNQHKQYRLNIALLP